MGDRGVKGGAGDWGDLLFTSRMTRDSPHHRIISVIFLFPLLLILYITIEPIMLGEFDWFFDGTILVVLTVFIIFQLLLRFPWFLVYEQGFITTPDSLTKAVLFQGTFVPFEGGVEYGGEHPAPLSKMQSIEARQDHVTASKMGKLQDDTRGIL